MNSIKTLFYTSSGIFLSLTGIIIINDIIFENYKITKKANNRFFTIDNLIIIFPTLFSLFLIKKGFNQFKKIYNLYKV